ncbi:MAG: hypothetical protein WDN04_22630 [Rhodospirillales bacterium]
MAPPVPAGPPRVALLLPLTGPKADLAQSMLKAAQLALAAPGSPVLDVQDTGGDPGACRRRGAAGGGERRPHRAGAADRGGNRRRGAGGAVGECSGAGVHQRSAGGVAGGVGRWA